MQKQLIAYKPTTPSRRHLLHAYQETSRKSTSPLKISLKKTFNQAGRNNCGIITCFTKSWRHKRRYRAMPLLQNCTCGFIEQIEYDPFRSVFLARLINFDTMSRYYILASNYIKQGDVLKSRFAYGQPCRLIDMPVGSLAFNFANKYCKAAGTFGVLLQKTNIYALVRFRSGLKRMFHAQTHAIIGVSSNALNKIRCLAKAGRSRWVGKKPSIRGVATNPIDHPHGGKTVGGKIPVSPWAKPTKGYKTKTKNFTVMKKYVH